MSTDLTENKTSTPTILTKEIKQKIADLVTSGLDPEKDKQQIAEILGLSPEVLKDLFMRERQDRLLKKAEITSEELLDIDLNSKEVERIYGKNRVAVMKLKLAESQFIRETLGKDTGYSKRNEITGKNGEEIRIKEIIFNPPVMVKHPPKSIDQD